MKRLTGRIELEATGEPMRPLRENEPGFHPTEGYATGPTKWPCYPLRVRDGDLVETEIAPPSGADAVALAHYVRNHPHAAYHTSSFSECKSDGCTLARDILERAKAAEPATAVMVEPTPDATVEPDPAAELRAAIEAEQTCHERYHGAPWGECKVRKCLLARAAEAYLKGNK